jgi:hypothetical protein
VFPDATIQREKRNVCQLYINIVFTVSETLEYQFHTTLNSAQWCFQMTQRNQFSLQQRTSLLQEVAIMLQDGVGENVFQYVIHLHH